MGDIMSSQGPTTATGGWVHRVGEGLAHTRSRSPPCRPSEQLQGNKAGPGSGVSGRAGAAGAGGGGAAAAAGGRTGRGRTCSVQQQQQQQEQQQGKAAAAVGSALGRKQQPPVAAAVSKKAQDGSAAAAGAPSAPPVAAAAPGSSSHTDAAAAGGGGGGGDAQHVRVLLPATAGGSSGASSTAALSLLVKEGLDALRIPVRVLQASVPGLQLPQGRIQQLMVVFVEQPPQGQQQLGQGEGGVCARVLAGPCQAPASLAAGGIVGFFGQPLKVALSSQQLEGTTIVGCCPARHISSSSSSSREQPLVAFIVQSPAAAAAAAGNNRVAAAAPQEQPASLQQQRQAEPEPAAPQAATQAGCGVLAPQQQAQQPQRQEVAAAAAAISTTAAAAALLRQKPVTRQAPTPKQREAGGVIVPRQQQQQQQPQAPPVMQQPLQQTSTPNTDSQQPSVPTITKTSPISKTYTVSPFPIKHDPEDATCIKPDPEVTSAQQQQQQQGTQCSMPAAAVPAEAAPAAAAAAATVLVKLEPQDVLVAADTAAAGTVAAVAAPCLEPQSQQIPGFTVAVTEPVTAFTATPITEAGAAPAGSSLQAPAAPQHPPISNGQDGLPGQEGGLPLQPAHQPTRSQHIDVAAAAGVLAPTSMTQHEAAAHPVLPAAPSTLSTDQVFAAGGGAGDQQAATDTDGSTGTPPAAALRNPAQPTALLFPGVQQVRGLSSPANSLDGAVTGTGAAAAGEGEAVDAVGALVTLGSGISSAALPLCMPALPVLCGRGAVADRSELSDAVVNSLLDLVMFLHKHADPGLDFLACIQALDGLREQQAAAQRFMRVGYVALASAVRVGNTAAAVTLVKLYLQQRPGRAAS